MTDCLQLDLQLLTSLIDEDMELSDETTANDKVKSVMQSSEAQTMASSDPQQELRLLEERMSELRKQIQAKSLHDTVSAAQLTAQDNGGHQKQQKILKDINLFDTHMQNKSTENFFKDEPKRDSEKLILHTGDTDSSDDEANRNPMEYKYNEFGQFVKKRLAHKSKLHDTKANNTEFSRGRNSSKLNFTGVSKQHVRSNSNTNMNQEKVEVEAYSGIRIINPLVSSHEMQERMVDRKMVKMSTIRMHMRGGDIEGDWVTIGVLVNKSEPKKSSKGNAFSVWKLCDLKDCNKLVALFLFGKTHETHWKTVVGSVIGILNADFLPDKDSMNSKGNGSELCIKVDNPQKILLMGASKDFGLCRGKRKDGASCTMLVNKAQSEFCHYHIQKEYRKSSSKRMDLQASYSGPEPTRLRSKILQKQQVMYGGQIYVSPGPRKVQNSASKSKDRLTLESLHLQKKATEIANTERAAIQATHLSSTENEMLNALSEPMAKLLTVPSAGSQNLLKHMTKLADPEIKPSKANSPSVQIKSITAKELLKLHEVEMQSKRACNQLRDVKAQPTTTTLGRTSENDLRLTPKLARGLKPGESIDLELSVTNGVVDKAKAKAIYHIQTTGALQKSSPNAVKKNRLSPEFQEKVKKRLAEELDDYQSEAINTKKLRSHIDTSSETFQKLLNQKSKYEHLVEGEILKIEEKYFSELEKKEKLEDKMISTMEVPCKAVSCKKCKYTALAALDSCRTNGHPLVVHKALKRFFKCKDCSKRIIGLSKLPTKPCRGCGGNNYERVAMWMERAGPKLGGETLSIRGDEAKHLNSLACSNIDLNL